MPPRGAAGQQPAAEYVAPQPSDVVFARTVAASAHYTPNPVQEASFVSAAGVASGMPALPEPSPFRPRPVAVTNPSRLLTMVHAPDSQAAAQYRLLKFKLKERGDPRVIAFTSARPREGKTSVAANLALALAEGKRARVAMLDANFRSPALPETFGLSVAAGLTDSIRRRRREQVPSPWEVLELAPSFHLLPAGRAVENPAALLNSEEFAVLLKDLRLNYDYVVVDTPAVLAAADVHIVQDMVDGVVLVSRAGQTTKTAIKETLKRLAGHNLLGTVLLGA